VPVVLSDACQEAVEVGAGELPVEGPGGGVVVLSEGEDLGGEGLEVLEVVGGEQLALDDGEVDFGLVELGGVDGQVDHLCVRVGVAEPGCRRPVPVRGAAEHRQLTR
jgi:hypothetical protein